MKRNQHKLEILANRKVKGRYCKITLAAGALARSALPGQFLMVKAAEAGELLLRRPLSVHRVSGFNLEIIYEVVGKGTEILSRRKTGDYLDVIGPLGNGFSCPRSSGARAAQILVAGGIGVAPLLFLTQRLLIIPGISDAGKITVLIGARTKQQVLCAKEFKKIGCDVKIATDDGSQGFPGRVTALLEDLLRATTSEIPAIYACGPKPMLKEIIRISGQKHIPAQVSLEAHMACGIGACLGCVVNTQNGYKRVCKDGPVFPAQEVLL